MNQFQSPQDILDACLGEGSEQGWTIFVRTFQPVIASSIARTLSRYSAPDAVLIDDLTQETFLRLCRDNARLLRDFQSRHEKAIFGYLKVIAISVALDHFRARTAQKRAMEVPTTEAAHEPHTSESAIEQEAILRQIDSKLSATESARDRSIFWLYYRQGYTAREIANLPGVDLTQKGVESCIYRLTCLLRREADSPMPPRPGIEGKRVRNALGEME